MERREFYRRLGIKICEARTAGGITQATLAAALAFHTMSGPAVVANPATLATLALAVASHAASISRIEAGLQEVGVTRLQQIADALQVTAASLLPRLDDLRIE